ncbi:MAG: hypothetical protein H7A03_09975 [Pseudomonadales bacterium]|nr:hypothetical protein [Anaerolineae bacterium]MCP5303452.1 hypothetical protein [Pseudomonadales bacterium]
MTDPTHKQLSAQEMLKRVFQIAQIAANADVDLEESSNVASTSDENQPQKHEDAIPV